MTHRRSIRVLTVAFCVLSAVAVPEVRGQATRGNTGAPPPGGTMVRAAVEVPQTIREFLAHVNEPAAHDRFWDDDLIYTGASGVRRTKAEIMKSVRDAATKPKSASSDSEQESFDGSDFLVKQIGEIAICNFKLTAHDGAKMTYFRNTGTFVKHDGEWKAIAWQATRIADAPGESNQATKADEKR